jgi:hypothetical protein
MAKQTSILTEVANYVKQYVVFSDDYQPIVLAAWTIATHVWPIFDALAYLAITAETKRAGKSRLGVEVLQYLVSMGKVQVAPTPAGIFRDITNLHPTLIFDEAESMSSEAKSVMRALMNAGYKKGQKITRAIGKSETQDFDVYCPKVFILIGSPNSTLADRSIIVQLRRSLEGPMRRYVYGEVLAEAGLLREKMHGIAEQEGNNIYECYVNEHADYLVSDRDEEIVRPVLAIAKTLGTAEEYEAVRKAVVDISTMKTAPKIKENFGARKDNGAVGVRKSLEAGFIGSAGHQEKAVSDRN